MKEKMPKGPKEDISFELTDDLFFNSLIRPIYNNKRLFAYTLIGSIVMGLLIGTFLPKKYESYGVLRIGKIFDKPIDTPRGIRNTVKLIFNNRLIEENGIITEVDLNCRELDISVIEIKATSTSADISVQFINTVFDTIITRHNNLILPVIKPLQIELDKVTAEIEMLKEFYKTNHKNYNNNLNSMSPSLAMFNNTKSEIVRQLVEITNSQLYIKPFKPEKHSSPGSLSYTTLLISFFIFSLGYISILLKELFTDTEKK